jgi:hypothetical protein
MRNFWTGFATALVIVVSAGFMAVASETVRCTTLGPKAEVKLCAVGHLDLPRFGS